MSAIAWLFGLGALTIAFPFLFHLIRRTPTGQTNFSSLMFLKPSPPRLTKRSRLENWLLLLLRCGVILALAFAFMRPFFRDGTQIPLAEVPGRNIAILLDSSVSMKRGELFDDAKSEVESLLGQLKPQDRVALFTFDSQLRPITSFPESTDDDSKGAVRRNLKELKPSWHRGNLGVAIASAADRLVRLSEESSTQADGQIYVVSDFQKSAPIGALQSVSWPQNIKLQSIVVSSDTPNASVQILKDSEDAEQVNAARVRIQNSENAKSEAFQLAWDSGQSTSSQEYYVASKSSQIFQILLPEQPARTLRLTGDETDFDNQFFFVQPRKRQRTVLILGSDDPADPDELRYYFEAALRADVNTDSTIGTPDELGNANPQMILVTDPVNEREIQIVDEFLESGGLVAFVAHDENRVDSFSRWIGGEFDSTVARRRKYSLLGNIDFQHPLFSNFNSAGLNDFTSIKFWQRARVQLDQPDSNQIIAAFDDDTPAIWSREQGNGKIVCLALGWQPEKSQLALSPKFLPMIYELVEMAANEREPIAGLIVGQPIALDSERTSTAIQTPNGDRISIQNDQTRFEETDEPGIYTLFSDGDQRTKVAVNVDPLESALGTMNIEQLEALGVSVGEQATVEETVEQMRTMKDSQLESRQKIWKWAILLALALLAAETYVAAKRPKGVEVSELSGTTA